MKPILKLRFRQQLQTALAVGLIICFWGCQSGQQVKVLNPGTDSYASLKVSNPFGNAISFVPAKAGAIGYIQSGDTTWVKGQPKVTALSETQTSFMWENPGGKVVMTMESVGTDKKVGFHLESATGQPSEWFLNIAAGKDEYFTGVFERVVDGTQYQSWKEGITTALNLRGERVEVKLKPTVSAYSPFYISSANYALSVYGTWPGVIDFCKENPDLVQVSFEGPRFEFLLMTDKTPAGLVQRHAMETGPQVPLPKWAFGPWRWRDDHYNRKMYFDSSKAAAPYCSDIVEDVLMMKAYGIPCSAYWIDRPWGPGPNGFDDYEIDGNRLPDFENMVKWLNGQDMEVMMWIAPFVMGKMAEVAEAKGYYLISRNYDTTHQVLMDFTNPEGVKWWQENGPAKLAKMGVKGYKLDRADGEKLLDSLNLKTNAGTTYRENYNDFPHQYIKATYEAVKPILGDDFVLFPRAMYAGSSRYGGMWAGDTGNPPEGLRSVLIGVQRCAVMGYPFWTSDTGGYPKEIDRETTKRWLGFACFSPMMEVGPTNNFGFWAMNYDPSFDNELLAAWRFYTNLRMDLLDYVYQAANQTCETGMPIVRPLFLEYPEQKESWEDWQTYKFGDDLLVSVIWEKGKNSAKVYLPAGETWIDLWNNKEYKGGQYIEVNSPAYQIPVFQRKGSTLSLPDLNKLYEESVAATSVKYKMSDLETREGWGK